MVRTHTHAMSRAAGFALLGPASRPQLDPARIATMSGTIAVNLLAFGLLMMPLAMPPPAVDLADDPHTTLVTIPKEEIVPVVPVTPPEPLTPTRRQPSSTTLHPAAPTTSSAAVFESGTEPATDEPVIDDGGPVLDIAPPSIGPAPVQLQYVSAPAPKYPRNAQMRGISGTVLLQVLVGTDGRALEVTVAQSSGNRELDEAARSQVLKRWSFRPATRDGRTIQALGMVPIEFTLR